MAKATLLVDALKRELKARGITYAQLAEKIEMSEASLKRMFSQKNFTLQRLDEILNASGIDLRDLSLSSTEESRLISELTHKQEEEIVGNPKILLLAASLLNLLSVEQIIKIYDITPVELTKYLIHLDKIGFLQLLPNNRVKLLVARTFRWIPNGPIHNMFKQEAYADYLDSDFDGNHEMIRVVNVMLSKTSAQALLNRMKQVAREFSDQHQEDASLPFEEKQPISFMLAARPWLPRPFKELIRKEYMEAKLKQSSKK
ncbi:MAG: XRE family transcriptional regulator [Burkholderiaceae bacterium]|nr:MAG: XRE family transcriptional regulator [Burkholderiaceae bacterium]